MDERDGGHKQDNLLIHASIVLTAEAAHGWKDGRMTGQHKLEQRGRDGAQIPSSSSPRYPYRTNAVHTPSNIIIVGHTPLPLTHTNCPMQVRVCVRERVQQQLQSQTVCPLTEWSGCTDVPFCNVPFSLNKGLLYLLFPLLSPSYPVLCE